MVFVLGMSTKHYQCWKFWSMATWATQILIAVFFKHKYLTNPLVAPEEIIIAAAENLARVLETSIPLNLQVSTIQALKDLSDVFTDATHKYCGPDAPPSHPHQKPTASPWVLPSPLSTQPPRVHTTTVSPKEPGILPTHAPSSVQHFLFPPDVSSVGPDLCSSRRADWGFECILKARYRS